MALRALRPANQLTSTPYASDTPFSLTQRDSYPALGTTQSECPDQFPYRPQQYIQSVNYAAPPYDLADYPVSYPVVLMTWPNIHRALLRCFQVLPTIAGSMPPRHQQSPTSSIHPQILIHFTTQHMTTPRTFLPTASTACHLAANINKIWSQIMQAIYAVMILLIITKPLPNTPSFPFLHPPDLLNSAMLL